MSLAGRPVAREGKRKKQASQPQPFRFRPPASQLVGSDLLTPMFNRLREPCKCGHQTGDLNLRAKGNLVEFFCAVCGVTREKIKFATAGQALGAAEIIRDSLG